MLPHLSQYRTAASNCLSFSLVNNRFSSVGRVLTYTPGGTGVLTEDVSNNGDIDFQVLLTDYSTYAFVDVCQTDLTGEANEYVMLLVRSLASAELTLFPVLGNIFNTFFGLTNYAGGFMRYVYQDTGLCRGI